MSPKSLPGRSISNSVEPLEARIAPARIIVVGLPNNGSGRDTDYVDSNPLENYFVNLETANQATDFIAAAVGKGVEGVNDTFYIKLQAGDILKVRVGDQFSNVLEVTSGEVIAFFQDDLTNPTRINEVDITELQSLSLSKNAAVIVRTNIVGDIVANYDSATGKLNMSADDQSSFSFKSLNIGGGNLQGNLLSGGSITQVNVRGNVGGIYAGSAADGIGFDFFPALTTAPGVQGGEGVFGFSTVAKQAGASISGVTISGNVLGTAATPAAIHAGDGGLGAVGGSLSQISVQGDADGFVLQAGNGGNAATATSNGGAGGSVKNIFVGGLPQAAMNEAGRQALSILAGFGGNAAGGVGGKGGSLSGIYVGFSAEGSRAIPSLTAFADAVLLQAGDGGVGKTGGAGGTVTKVRATLATPDVVPATGFNVTQGHELLILGGNGGATPDNAAGTAPGTKTGAGGSVSDVVARNQIAQAVLGGDVTSTVVLGGNGGTLGANSAAAGGAGGKVSNVTLLSSRMRVDGGDGAAGSVGGAGGLVTDVTVLRELGIFAHVVDVAGGTGGNSSKTGALGGTGGDVTKLTASDGKFTEFSINKELGEGQGGANVNGKGGRGGNVSNIVLGSTEDVSYANVLNQLTVNGGDGGAGASVGGAGGKITSATLEVFNLNASVLGGTGGNATVNGAGGVGGDISKLDVVLRTTTVLGLASPLGQQPVLSIPNTATVQAGDGGAGTAVGGKQTVGLAKGGKGGSVLSTNVNTAGQATLLAGDGGDAEGLSLTAKGATPGVGGTLNSSVLYAGFAAGLYDNVVSRETYGSGVLRAGNAGGNGTLPAVGGSVVGTSTKLAGLYVFANLEITAGQGSSGGAGGSISFAGYGSSQATLLPTPSGNITIRAGDGSVDNTTTGGAGGSISNLNGSVSSGAGKLTLIQAGDGGSASLKGGVGGNLTNITLQRGPANGAPAGTVELEAGDGGSATAGKLGANGGNVTGVTALNIGSETVLRHIGAGDGGNAATAGDAAATATKGGQGGSITRVNVRGNDIGVRTGEAFGYDRMGGIFAGVGGVAGTDSTNEDPALAKAGLAGSVSYITAESISSIVAGKTNVPRLVERVDHVILNGLNDLQPARTADVDSQFVLTYRPLLAYAGNDGTAGSPEMQTFTRLAGGSGEATPTTFTLTFPNTAGMLNTTPALNANADAATIQEVLNDLPSIQEAGGVTVAGDGGAGSLFTVTFNQNSDRPRIQAVGLESTQPLAGNSSAASVEAALNALPNLRGGGLNGVDVFTSDTASYQIKFLSVGDRGLITGQALLPASGITVTQGALAAGLQAAVAENQLVDFLGTGDYSFTYHPLVQVALATTPEAGLVQQFTRLAPGTAASPTTFTLSYGGQTTMALPANASADDIEFALNSLSSIRAAGQVDVTENGAQVNIAFFSGTAAAGLITGEGSESTPFLASSNTQTQAQRVQQVQSALNALPNIGANGVTVRLAPDLAFDITFNSVGDKGQITGTERSGLNTQTLTPGTAADNEVQTLNFPILRPASGFIFNVPTAGGGTTQVEIPRLGSNEETLAAVQAGLNANATIAAVGGVTVTLTPDNTFTIRYNVINVNAAQITASELLPTANITRDAGAPVSFTATETLKGDPDNQVSETQTFQVLDARDITLTFGGITTAAIPVATATNVTVQNALSGLNSIMQAGGVTVTGTVESGFTVTFNSTADVQPITGSRLRPADQIVDVNGSGPFTLTFNGATTTALSATASAETVETTLNALSTVITAGGVDVVYDADTTSYRVVFRNTGAQNEITAQETLPLNASTLVDGSTVSREIQQLQIVPRTPYEGTAARYGVNPLTGVLQPVAAATGYYAANLVGAIADFNEFGSGKFKFIDANDNGLYDQGEVPIDGLVIAKNFSQRTSNFTPQARYVVNSDIYGKKAGDYRQVPTTDAQGNPIYFADNQGLV